MAHHQGLGDESQDSKRAGRPEGNSTDSNATSSPSRQNPQGSGQGHEERAIQGHVQRAANYFARQHEPDPNVAKPETSSGMTSKSNNLTFNNEKGLKADGLRALADKMTKKDVYVVRPLYSNGKPTVGRNRKRGIANSDALDEFFEDAYGIKPPPKAAKTSSSSRTPRTSQTPQTSKATAAGQQSRTAIKQKKVCRICQVGTHTADKCIKVIPGTGMMKFCPIHPALDDHALDQCPDLEEYLRDPHKIDLLHEWMGPARVGMPPIYTELICINQLTRYLGKLMKLLPWTVERSVHLWHLHRETLNDSLDYDFAPALPADFNDPDRAAITTYQLLGNKAPADGTIEEILRIVGAEHSYSRVDRTSPVTSTDTTPVPAGAIEPPAAPVAEIDEIQDDTVSDGSISWYRPSRPRRRPRNYRRPNRRLYDSYRPQRDRTSPPYRDRAPRTEPEQAAVQDSAAQGGSNGSSSMPKETPDATEHGPNITIVLNNCSHFHVSLPHNPFEAGSTPQDVPRQNTSNQAGNHTS